MRVRESYEDQLACGLERATGDEIDIEMNKESFHC